MNTVGKARHVLLGVTGSIAAYKAVFILRRLNDSGVKVTVVMTRAAREFVRPLTFEVLSGRPVFTSLFDSSEEIRHLTLAEAVDLVLISPATSNTIGKIANGISDDLLTTIVAASPAPLILAPAMDGEMWNNPALQKNISILMARGVEVIPPEDGPLASGKSGIGRLAPEELIVQKILSRLKDRADLDGETVLVTAGPTREAVDPVRFISNRSSGKMGYAIARAAQLRGARVILVSGPTNLSSPNGVQCIRVETAREMSEAVFKTFPESTIAVMAAAVSDYRPLRKADRKLKKDHSSLKLELERTPDILTEMSKKRTGQTLVGFAAETENLVENAHSKLLKKGIDLIVANDVTLEGAGFDVETNIVTMIDRFGEVQSLPVLPKSELADRILTQIKKIRNSKNE